MAFGQHMMFMGYNRKRPDLSSLYMSRESAFIARDNSQ
jgi:hypothetical protein